MSVDIYMLNKNKNIFDAVVHHDNSNLIFIEAKDDFICNGCNKKTILITHEKLCPKCSYNSKKIKCEYCYRHIGCVSCGGKLKNMIYIDNKLLCRTNRCLMAFGYFIDYRDSECTCTVDKYLVLCPDLSRYIDTFIPKKETCWNISRKLPNLIYSKGLKCTHCYLHNNYKYVGNMNTYNYKGVTCNCYNF